MHSEPKKIIPGLVWYRPFEPLAYPLVRFATGLLLAVHGVARAAYGIPPELVGILRQVPADDLGTCEFLAGVLLALGLLTRPIALLFMIEWIVIAAGVPFKPTESWFMFGATQHHPALIAALCFAFVLRGGGTFSLDRRMGKEF